MILGQVVASPGPAKAMPSTGQQVEQTLTMPGKAGGSIHYLLYLPTGYGQTDKRWPLMLFLHGRGESYGPLSLVKTWGPPRMVEQGHPLPYIIASPQCPKDASWSQPREQTLLTGLLDYLLSQYRADADRVYLTGLSMGGFGAWRMAADHPERFAAVVPICGGGRAEDAQRLKWLPIWVFHGDHDRAVPIERSREMVRAIRRAGSQTIRFTDVEYVGHNCWSAAYATPDLYAWIDQQTVSANRARSSQSTTGKSTGRATGKATGNAAGESTGDVARVRVFRAGVDGYHTYRIPALLATPKGTLLAFCEGRKTSGGDHGDIDLVLKRSNDGGRSWGPLELVYEEGQTAPITIGNPCPVVDRANGTLWLPFCRDNDRVLVTHSTDDGRTWSPPTEITGEVKRPDWTWYATGPGVGICLAHGPHRGRLVIPCDHRQPVDGRPTMFSHVFFSDDHGQKWQLGGSADKHTDECQVVELGGGQLMLNMRNYWGRTGKVAARGGMRAVAHSRDGGSSWSAITFAADLVEPVCQASLIRTGRSDPPGRERLLFSNPASKTQRHRLTVRLSNDGGRSWPTARLLYAGPAAYSCLAVLPDRSIGCLYEAGQRNAYETITFARFGLDWLNGP